MRKVGEKVFPGQIPIQLRKRKRWTRKFLQNTLVQSTSSYLIQYHAHTLLQRHCLFDSSESDKCLPNQLCLQNSIVFRPMSRQEPMSSQNPFVPQSILQADENTIVFRPVLSSCNYRSRHEYEHCIHTYLSVDS